MIFTYKMTMKNLISNKVYTLDMQIN